jgi:hypothetical protein
VVISWDTSPGQPTAHSRLDFRVFGFTLEMSVCTFICTYIYYGMEPAGL